ncbi:MAG TPA: hypothetical protein VMB66_14610, partial [Candidatus Acidoferrales bacterium]|nr:hypothetical protein [Candidatus Acidoferrales bacterium]
MSRNGEKFTAAFLVCLLTLVWTACSGSPSTSSLTSTPPPPPGNPVGSNLTQISSDPYSVAPGQHA